MVSTSKNPEITNPSSTTSIQPPPVVANPSSESEVELAVSELALMETAANDDDELSDTEIETKRKNARTVKLTTDELLSRLDALLNPSIKTQASNSNTLSSTATSSATSHRRNVRSNSKSTEYQRKSEEEEDKQLLEDEIAQSNDPNAVATSLGAVRVTTQPKNITATMRDYQIEALNWMLQLHDRNLNGILADEMGLGKTLETISLLAYLRENRDINGPHLIIVPKSTLTNWVREVTRWCPDFSVIAFQGVKEEREILRETILKYDIIVTTYEMCIIERSTIRKIPFEYIIIDEAHRIKNEKSKLSLVVRTFKSKHRLLITGTPLQNNLHELWALLNFLKPDLFHSHEDFATIFDLTSSSSDQDTVVKRLHRVLGPFLLRRLKADVATSLPPKIETKLYVGLTDMQREWYTKLLSRDIDTINETKASKTQLLNIMMQLRKVCNHPYLFDGAEPGPPYEEGPHIVQNSAKMILLDKLLRKLKEEDSRVLIFSQMTRLLDILEDYAIWKGYQYCRIDGSTKQEDRDNAMDVFNAPNSEKFIFLLSTRAGGLGINLQTADTVVLFDSDWNPQMDLQAMDRAHRIGQKKQVNVFRFVTEDSVEAKIVERATKKLALDAVVIQKGRLLEQEKSMSSDELQKMIRFGASYIFQSKGNQITDEDIDAILARGKEKTAAENRNLSESNLSLLNFSLDQSESQYNTLSFEGVDYSNIRKAQDDLLYIPTPSRHRGAQISFDENEYFREAFQTGKDPAKQKQAAAKKEFKPTMRYDFQFFNIPRLNELEKKNWEGEQKLKTIRQEYVLKKKQEEKEKALLRKEERRREKQEKAEKAEKERLRLLELQRIEEETDAAIDQSLDAVLGETGGNTTAKVETKAEAGNEGEVDKVKMEDDVKIEDDVKNTDSITSDVKMEDDGKAPIKDTMTDAMEDTKAKTESIDTDAEVAGVTASETATPTTTPLLPSTMKEKTITKDGKDSKDNKDNKDMKDEDENEEEEAEAEAEGDDEEEEEEEDDEEEDGNVQASSKNKKSRKRSKLNIASDGSIIDLAFERELRDMAGCCTEAEEAELEKLLKSGFPDWRRIDLNHFIVACSTYGRRDLVNISQNVEGFEPSEVRRYHKVFFQRYHEIKDGDKLLKQIERGEVALKRRKDIEKLIELKICAYQDPLSHLTFDYPSKQTSFNVINDRYLLLAMKYHGFGNWDAIRRDFLQAPQFRFDWFIKSRSAQEIAKRGDFLLKLIEKEIENNGKIIGSTASLTQLGPITASSSKRSRLNAIRNSTEEVGTGVGASAGNKSNKRQATTAAVAARSR